MRITHCAALHLWLVALIGAGCHVNSAPHLSESGQISCVDTWIEEGPFATAEGVEPLLGKAPFVTNTLEDVESVTVELENLREPEYVAIVELNGCLGQEVASKRPTTSLALDGCIPNGLTVRSKNLSQTVTFDRVRVKANGLCPEGSTAPAIPEATPTAAPVSAAPVSTAGNAIAGLPFPQDRIHSWPNKTPLLSPLRFGDHDAEWRWTLQQGYFSRGTHFGTHSKQWLDNSYAADLVPVDLGGARVVAAADGKVAWTGTPEDSKLWAAGHTVIIEHPSETSTCNWLYTVYSHLVPSSFAVSSGQHVRAGELLGEMGQSGYATGPHLHFAAYCSVSATPLSVYSDLTGMAAVKPF